MMTKTGQCIQFASVYAYFLLQAGVEAVQVGCTVPTMSHAWTYLVIDGKGYFSDTTWSLFDPDDDQVLYLYYFLMNGDRRDSSGCPVDNLTSPLLPRYWANSSNVDFRCDDDSLSFHSFSVFESMDEENKIIKYYIDSEIFEFKYTSD